MLSIHLKNKVNPSIYLLLHKQKGERKKAKWGELEIEKFDLDI